MFKTQFMEKTGWSKEPILQNKDKSFHFLNDAKEHILRSYYSLELPNSQANILLPVTLSNHWRDSWLLSNPTVQQTIDLNSQFIVVHLTFLLSSNLWLRHNEKIKLQKQWKTGWHCNVSCPDETKYCKITLRKSWMFVSVLQTSMTLMNEDA